MKPKHITVLVIGIALFIFVIMVYQIIYMASVDRTSSDGYIKSELERLEQEQNENDNLVKSLMENPYQLEGEQLTTEEKNQKVEEIFEDESAIGSSKNINDYMKQISEDNLLQLKATVQGLVEVGSIEEAVKQAKNIYETYDLNDYPEELEYFKNVKYLDFLTNADNYTSYKNNFSQIHDESILIHAFIRSNKNTQSEVIAYPYSEVIPRQPAIVKIKSREDCSPINEMRATNIFAVTRGFKGSKMVVSIDEVDYTFFIINNVPANLLIVYRTTITGQEKDGDSLNSYQAYIDYNVVEDVQTYGTPIKIS